MALVPIILSGGAGTRLWPLSRETAPKPFMPLPDGETLLAKTIMRAVALPTSSKHVKVAVAKLGDYSIVMGAAKRAWDQFHV